MPARALRRFRSCEGVIQAQKRQNQQMPDRALRHGVVEWNGARLQYRQNQQLPARALRPFSEKSIK